eukprot:4253977-Pyramimonas_sp.AAC.1
MRGQEGVKRGSGGGQEVALLICADVVKTASAWVLDQLSPSGGEFFPSMGMKRSTRSTAKALNSTYGGEYTPRITNTERYGEQPWYTKRRPTLGMEHTGLGRCYTHLLRHVAQHAVVRRALEDHWRPQRARLVHLRRVQKKRRVSIRVSVGASFVSVSSFATDRTRS